MMFKLFVLEILLTLFSCIVLAYISIATAIGPWIAPTLILLAQFIPWRKTTETKSNNFQTLILSQTAGSLGGIISVGIGFTLPMLYFLDSAQFNKMITNPLYFTLVLGGITLAAGSLGTWLARIIAPNLIKNEELTFPVSKMISETASQIQGNGSSSLLKGIFGSWGTILLRDGLKLGNLFSFPALIGNKQFFIGGSMLPKMFPVSISPTMWAIGWVAGMGMALPLFVGMLSKYLVLYPLNYHSLWLGLSFFTPIDKIEFSSAFCSGMVLFELLRGIIFQIIRPSTSNKKFSVADMKTRCLLFSQSIRTTTQTWLEKIEPLVAIICTIAVLTLLSIPWYITLLLPLACAAATYQISYFGARTGLAPFGRFITLFVMIPVALLFSTEPLQMTYLCVFTAVCLGAAINLLFQFKVGKISSIETKIIHKHHWIGLILTAIFIGTCFWLLLSNLELGSAELFAHRGRARALLLSSLNFDPIVLAIGCVFGALVKWFKLSPTMVFGGILMPNRLTIGLLTGALASKLVQNPNSHRPFWTGIFAGESLWISMTLLLKVILP